MARGPAVILLTRSTPATNCFANTIISIIITTTTTTTSSSSRWQTRGAVAELLDSLPVSHHHRTNIDVQLLGPICKISHDSRTIKKAR